MTPTDPKTREALLKLAAIRALLATDVAPFFARILYAFVVVPVRGMGTMAMDEKLRLFIDPEYVTSKPGLVVRGAVLHETGHAADKHPERAKAMKVTPATAKLWNLGADIPWNHLLRQWAKTKTITRTKVVGGQRTQTNEPAFEVGADWYYPETLDLPVGLTAEEYFVILREREAAKQQQQQQQQPPQSEQAGEQSEDEEQDGEQPESGDQPGDEAGGGEQPGEAGDDAGGAGGSPSDQPGEGEAGETGFGPGSGGGEGHKPGAGACGSCAGHDDAMADLIAEAERQNGPLPEGRTAGEREALRRETAADIVKHEATHGRGSVPEGILRWAEGVLGTPKVPWQERLRSVIKQGVAVHAGRTDFTFTRPSRRGQAVRDFVLPAVRSPKATVAVVADTSGSMGTSDLLTGLTEVQGILHSEAVEECWWIPTDAEADKATRIVTAKQARDRLFGGGGTNMGAGLDAASKLHRKPALTVVLTDGDTDWPARPPRGAGSIVIVLTRKSEHPAPEWARVITAY